MDTNSLNDSEQFNCTPAKILIVEDDESHLELIKKGFSDYPESATLVTAMTLKAAKVQILNDPPDLILADWLLPDGKGAELITLKNGVPVIPVVIMTSHGSEQVAVEVMKLGAIDYLVKSYMAFTEMPHISSRAIKQWKTLRDHARTEWALHENEQELALALHAARAGVWSYDKKTGNVHWSKEYAQLLGYEGNTHCKDYEFWVSHIYPDDRDMFNRIISDPSMSAVKDIDLEYRIVLPDGTIRWMNNRGRILFDSEKIPIRVLGISMDITDRKSAENALHESEERFRHLYKSGLIGIVFADKEKIWDANDKFLTDIGYTREDLNQGFIKWQEMTPPEWADADAKGLEELLSMGNCSAFEKEYYRKDGSRIPILIGGSLLTRDPLSWCCFILDITEQRQNEEMRIRALQQIEQNLLQLAALNDQIRNPLSIIVLLAENIGGEESKKIIYQAMQIDDLVNKLDQGWVESEKVRNFLIKHYSIYTK